MGFLQYLSYAAMLLIAILMVATGRARKQAGLTAFMKTSWTVLAAVLLLGVVYVAIEVFGWV